MPLDRRAQRLLDMLAGSGSSAAETPQARRAALTALAEMADENQAPGVVSVSTETDASGGAIPLTIHSPQGAAGDLPAMVFLHGGGWVAGGGTTHAGLCARLASHGAMRVIAADYRLAPEHRFPAAYDDALAATRWVIAEAPHLGVDPTRIAIGGDSVGGGLAAAVARELGAPALRLQLLICPILDPARTGGTRETLGDGYFISRATFARDLTDYLGPDADPTDPRVSPLRAPDFTGAPPALIHTAEFDPFRDEAETYAAALEAAGVAVTATRHAGMIHYFYAMARAIPYANEAAALIGAQLRSALGPAPAS